MVVEKSTEIIENAYEYLDDYYTEESVFSESDVKGIMEQMFEEGLIPFEVHEETEEGIFITVCIPGAGIECILWWINDDGDFDIDDINNILDMKDFIAMIVERYENLMVNLDVLIN